MARAQFQKGQKVWVESVGALAQVESVQPVWAQGFHEPVRVTYDVGLGREFQAHELMSPVSNPAMLAAGRNWRLMRARNKWQTPEESLHHPYPGTYPVIVTDRADWGGWRVPGAEYDRDPEHIEFQARLIASSPRLLALAERIIKEVDTASDDAPPVMREMAREAKDIIKSISEIMAVPGEVGEASRTHPKPKAA